MPGKTVIDYTCQQLSADLPAPPDAERVDYYDALKRVTAYKQGGADALMDFYRAKLPAAGWQATTENAIQDHGKRMLIYRNPAKDMLTLAMSARPGGNTQASVHFQSAAELAELDRQIEEQAPKIRAAAAAKQADEAKRMAEANKLPKIALPVPPEATNFENQKGEMKFTVSQGKARAVAETMRKQFAEMGWKEEMASLDAMTGALSVTKESQHVTISYTDTGVLPSEVNISAMGVELERQ